MPTPSARAARAPLAVLLPILAALLLPTSRAEAACSSTTPPLSDGDDVVCDGTDSTGFDGSGATNLTITTSGVTTLDDSDAGVDAAIVISDDNTVTLGADATVTVTEANGAGVRGGDRNTVTNDGTIVVDGADGVAIDVGSLPDPDPVPTPSVTNNGTITLNGARSVGLRSVDNYDLTNAASGTITVGSTAVGGIAIQGGNDNFVQSDGTIVVDADDGRAISIGTNTGLPLPNGAVLGAGSTTTLNGARTIAVEVGDDVGVALSGTIDVLGDEARGLSAGDRTDPDAQANFTNTAGATINVGGDDAYGMKVGDGWTNATTGAVDTRNFGNIDVTGARSYGVFTGDETNAVGDNDSFVENRGRIDVTGVDAVGLSLGGNDLLAPFDLLASDPTANVNLFDVANVGGSIVAGPDAGPLIEFRDFVVGRENRVLNQPGSQILADLTNLGTANRGIAVLGSDGSDAIFNEGEIRGDLMLMGGDDRYVHISGGTLDGTVRGGAGSDELFLYVAGSSPEAFDVSVLDAFERIRVYGASRFDGSPVGWAIENGAGFTGVTEVVAGGRLAVLQNGGGFAIPQTLGGDLVIDPDGSVAIPVDGSGATPLTILGDATFDGTLVVQATSQLTPTNATYRLIDVTGPGGRGTSVFANEVLPGSMGLFAFSTIYDATGVSLLVQQMGTFSSVARGANQHAIAGHLDAIFLDGTSAPELQTQLNDLAFAFGQLNNVYDALSPEAYDAQTTVIADGAQRVAGLLFDRPRDCDPNELDPWQGSNAPLPCHAQRLAPWVATIGSLRERDAFTGRPEYESQLAGLVFGVDLRPVGDLELTLALATQRGTVDVENKGDTTLTLVDLTAHAGWSHGPFRVQGAAGWGFADHDSERAIRFAESATPVDLIARDDHSSQRVWASAEAGLLFELPYVSLEPLVRADWTWIDQDAIREGDASVYGLAIDERDDSIVDVSAGIRLSTVYEHRRYLHSNFEWMDGVWRPSLDLRWRQTLTGNERDLTARLVGAADTVGDFRIEGKEDAGGFEVGAGLAFVPENANRLQLDLRYELFRSAHALSHDLVAKVLIGF